MFLSTNSCLEGRFPNQADNQPKRPFFSFFGVGVAAGFDSAAAPEDPAPVAGLGSSSICKGGYNTSKKKTPLMN